MIKDKILSYRDTMVEDMLEFVEKNLTINQNSLMFITSDSTEVNEHILKKYGINQSISIPGTIITLINATIDRNSTHIQ